MGSDDLTQEALKAILHYDPETGIFTRFKAVGRYAKEGTVGHVSAKDGYVRIWVKGRLYLAQRLAWLYMTGEWPTLIVDHENRNGSDNRWVNLRPANKVQNAYNSKMYKTNTSGFKGVWLHRKTGKWVAMIRITHVGPKYLGLFATPEEASAVYKAAVNQIAPGFAEAA